MSDGPILDIQNLSVDFQTRRGPIAAVRDVSLKIMPGETVAIVGESGSGKTTTALSINRLLVENARIRSGAILLNGEDIAHASESRMTELRGRTVAMIPQDPMSSLNPVWSIGFQVRETFRESAQNRHSRRLDAIHALEDAGLADAADRLDQYPHEFSGGMRQRALIAIALASNPRLLIADEPTSALDVTVQRRILDHLATMTASRGTSMLLITHDLGVAAERANRIIVMYRGRVVESGPAREVVSSPEHPYTRRLIAAAPSLSSPRAKIYPTTAERTTPGSTYVVPTEPLLLLEGVTKSFRVRGNKTRINRVAVDDVSLAVERGTTLAIVGESGSGKSTLARIALGLTRPDFGRTLFDGRDTWELDRKGRFDFHRRVQPIFQDPFGSLDPLYSVFNTVVEPLRVHKVGDRVTQRARVQEVLDRVGLPTDAMHRFPTELSGGQRQRVAIARALALGPELVICDEPVSALDVLVQAQVLDLLKELQRDLGLTYLFITHDLAVVQQIATRVAVMNSGKVVEIASVDDVFQRPRDAYTRELLAAIPGNNLS